ncbi:MAG: hypothetical protein ACXACH_05600 [Candidatus Hermodarchaeia archaeon]|jgi:hypothetical protein
MADTIDRVISDRLEVLSRSIFPVNYVFSKTYEYAIKHRDCAMTIATKSGTQVNFTEPVKIHPKLLEREGPFAYRKRLYYVKELNILNSFLVITNDQLELPHKDDPKTDVNFFVKAVKPYITAVDDIIRRRFGTIVIRISTRDKPLVLHRQTVKGKQTLTANELLAEMNTPMELRLALKEVLFRTKPDATPPAKSKKQKSSKEIRASFLTLEEGRIILYSEGAIQAQEFVELGKVPYQFENIDGPVPARQIITSFLQLENKTVAQLLEEFSELAFLPFFFDLYLEQGGPPIRNVALFDGQLIIGQTPESNVREGAFEIFVAKKGVDKRLSE